MRPTNIHIACAILVIFITLSNGDQGKIEAYYEDAKEILPGPVYYWRDWCFCRDTTDLYIWSEAVVLKLWITSILGWFQFVIDGKLMMMESYSDNENKTNPKYELQEVRRKIKLTNYTQPMLSHAGGTKLFVGNWFLISRKEGEMTIQHTYQENIYNQITLQEDFPGFKCESNGEKQTFSANTSLGAEFSTSWITGRKTNQSLAKTKALEPQTEHQSNFTSCSKLNTNSSDSTLTKIQCHTNSRQHNITYVWNIDRFSSHIPAEGDNENNLIISPTFSSVTYDELKWYLEIGPRNNTSDTISLCLRLNNSLESQKSKPLAQFTVDFLDCKGNLIYTRTPELHIFDTDNWGLNDIPVKEVVSSDDKLNIACKITISEFMTKAFYRNRTDTISNPNYNPNQDVIPIIKNIEFPDIVLVLPKNGKEYPAHKVILAARSPKFETMFKRRMEKGKKIKRIIIKDVDEQVFDEVLRYIYTGKCENVGNLTGDLLVAAKKYNIEGLKTICIGRMIQRLTIGNAVDTLILAHRHGIGELKSKAIRFIAANYAQISNSTDWKHIIETKNSKFVHKVCQVLSNSNISDKEIAED